MSIEDLWPSVVLVLLAIATVEVMRHLRNLRPARHAETDAAIGTGREIAATPPYLIEPGVRDVCAAIAALDGTTIRWGIYGKPDTADTPRIVFTAPLDLIERIARALRHGSTTAPGFTYLWMVTGSFCPDESGLQWFLKPNDMRVGAGKWDCRALDADLARLAQVLSKMADDRETDRVASASNVG